jgi:hypothetical protein
MKALTLLLSLILVRCPCLAAGLPIADPEVVAQDRTCWEPEPWMDEAARTERWRSLEKDAEFAKVLAHLAACKPAAEACLAGYLSRCFSRDDLKLYREGALADCLRQKQIPGISQDGQYLHFSEPGNGYDAVLVYEKTGWKLHSFKVYGD